ncbi:MAG TPA: matrixin family metalloprotease [Thermoanaerobaculia bacterium]|nr:matrixin family metalloprotease [Thermoanaerobaculia bacterium]
MLVRYWKRLLPLAGALFLLAEPLAASARLTYTIGSQAVPVSWPAAAFPIKYRVDSRLANALPNATAIIDRAFAIWAGVPDANLSFQSLGVADGLKPGNDGKNTISLTDDLFENQSVIAMTTNWYDGSGKVTEADIQVDGGMVNGNYNIQQALAHEVGHLLGLDHSAVLSSIMYPWVPRGNETPVLDSDDRIAIASIYPKIDPTLMGGAMQGRVIGDKGGVFAAQVVALNEKGEPVATALTSTTGDFTIQALPAGNYRLYAEPLDGPVDARNFAGVWRTATVTSFPTHFCDSGTIQVESGKLYGNLIVNTSGAPVQLNPRWIGVTTPGNDQFNLSSNALYVRPGQSINIALAGEGITSGMTTFTVLNPGFKRTSDFRYAGNYVYATFSIAPDAPAGSVVIIVDSGNQEATLTGALRIAIPPGRVRSVRH